MLTCGVALVRGTVGAVSCGWLGGYRWVPSFKKCTYMFVVFCSIVVVQEGGIFKAYGLSGSVSLGSRL